jgi:hypothetical protein
MSGISKNKAPTGAGISKNGTPTQVHILLFETPNLGRFFQVGIMGKKIKLVPEIRGPLVVKEQGAEGPHILRVPGSLSITLHLKFHVSLGLGFRVPH